MAATHELPPEQDLLGEWWLPHRPEHRLAGRLTHRKGRTAVLELLGHLDSAGGPATILGRTRSALAPDVTICEAVVTAESLLDTTMQQFSSPVVFYGAHLPRGMETRFESVAMDTFLLSEWVARPFPDVEWDAKSVDSKEELLGVKLHVPPDLSCTIPELGELALRWRGGHLPRAQRGEVYVRPAWHLKFSEARTMQEIWQAAVTPLVFFSTFAVGQGDGVVSLRLAPLDGEWVANEWSGEQVSAEWWGMSWRDAPLDDTWPNHETLQLVPFSSVEERFSSILPGWFDVFRSAPTALLDLFLSPVSRQSYLEDAFLRQVRGMETWHRQLEGGAYMDPAEFKELLQRLKSAAGSPACKNFVSMRLQHANELTLKQRLDALVEKAGGPVVRVVEQFDRFTSRAKDTRNEMTHPGAAPDPFHPHELPQALLVLQVVMRAVMLRRLNFDGADVWRSLARTQEWRAASSGRSLRSAPLSGVRST